MAVNLKLSSCIKVGLRFSGSRYFSATAAKFESGIKHVAIIGGGLMGSGIAQVAAQSKCHVVVCDINDQMLAKSQKTITSSLQRLAKKTFKDDKEASEKYIADVCGRISYVTRPEDAASNVDLVIEAVVEDLSVKKQLFAKLDLIADKSTIFATNTSSMLISSIAESIQQRRDRFFGLHFFNPVPVMKLVEVINIQESDPAILEKVSSWVRDELGKHVVHCKDVPGFIVNQLLVPYSLSAMMLLERGDASAKDIDIAMKLGAGVPMGPLELADYIGLDTVKFIAKSLREKKDYSPMFVECPKILERLVAENKLGVKSGEGFFKYK